MDCNVFLLVSLVIGLLCVSQQVHGEELDPATDENLETVVSYFNSIRSLLAFYGGASNMKKLNWSKTMARKASERAQELLDCSQNYVQADSYVVEEDGLFVEIICDESGDGMLGVIFRLLDHCIARSSSGSNCNHLFLILWAESCTVGCGTKQCDNSARILVCEFDPIADFTALTPFLTGPHCSGCESQNVAKCLGRNGRLLCSGECGPDMMAIDDPHFSVRLPTGQLLCFDVKGEEGKYFNLISTDEFEMNAQFVKFSSSNHPKNSWLGAIGVTMSERTIVFDSKSGTVSVDEEEIIDPSSIQTITIDGHSLLLEGNKEEGKRAHRVEVFVKDLAFRFTVIFKRSKSMNPHLDMLWHSGTMHKDCIHGLLGQFLSSAVMVDEANLLLILPGRPLISVVQKHMLHSMQSEAPIYKNSKCWVAKRHSDQGAGIIEGSYIDYEVDSLLSIGFSFDGVH